MDWLPFYLSLLAEALNFIVMANCNSMNFSVAVDDDLYIDLMLLLILSYRCSLLVDCKKVKKL